MQAYQLNCQMLVRKPIREVFEVFENPYNLKKITPPWLNFAVISKRQVEMKKGEEIDYEFRWMGLPMRWRTLISHYQPPVGFVDQMLRGPYTLWHHRHSFEERPEGTLVIDQVHYILPFGPLGRLAHALMVKANLVAIFTYRQKTLNEMWGGQSEIVWPTVQVTEWSPSAAGTANQEAPAR